MSIVVDVAVRELVAGDVVVLPNGLVRRVLRVEAFDELTGRDPGERCLVIVTGGSSQGFESKASAAKGRSVVALDEQALRPYRPDELVKVERA